MIEVLKQALEVLNDVWNSRLPLHNVDDIRKAKASLRQAIAELENQKPVAWMRDDGMKAMTNDEKQAWIQADRGEIVEDYNTPLTRPPQRTWVGLTEEEMHDCWGTPLTPYGLQQARAMEAKLKELNDHSI